MTPQALVPVLPESAPFMPEQRAYLNGFFAGLFSRASAPVAAAAPAQKTLVPLTILFGSQTGNAEKLAKRIAREAGKRGFTPTVQDLAKYSAAQLAGERHLLVVTSTYGDGEPPDNAKAFWKFLSADDAPRLADARFSVCSLGDQNYPNFCAFGRALDARLEKLGARRVQDRQDCDVDLEKPFLKWLDRALSAMGAAAGALLATNDGAVQANAGQGAECHALQSVTFNRERPYPALLITNRRLNGEGSAKDVRHFEIALGDSGLTYEVGDALGVWPANHPALVQELLTALGFDGEEAVPGKDDAKIPLRLALQTHFEITRFQRPLLEHFAQATGDATLAGLTSPTANGDLQKYLWGREVIDLLLAYPQVKFTPEEFAGLLRKLQPRLYSIASSLKAHPGEVHLCVSAVRYQSLGRARRGVASTFLADGITADMPVPVFVHENPAFRPPSPDAPLIMIGPGTGIAPFRAFLEERRATAAKGRNWLFFGDQHVATDYLYREEIEAFHRDGLLTRLDLAWSRDQEEKTYVQNQMLERAKELLAWLEDGGCVCVCGDASRMAKDVDAALHQVVQSVAGKTAEQAVEYVQKLAAEKRYVRDVY